MIILLLTILVILGTVFLGWWTIPVLGMAYGFWCASKNAAFVASGSALAGWSILMTWNFIEGPVIELSDSIGTTIGLPGKFLLLVTLLFPAVLAWAATTLGVSIRNSQILSS
tara:strand:+ start:1545 stop:1880 length:336 start_codon:yes stop_codon:yes gene_type:complete